jgi:hypothetical protein
VTLVMGVTLVTYVTFVSNIIVMCHWSPNVSQEKKNNQTLFVYYIRHQPPCDSDYMLHSLQPVDPPPPSQAQQS